MKAYRRIRHRAVLITTLALVPGVIVFSPLLLLTVGTLGPGDWSRLSDIGQAYGFTSALLSALALGAVALSMASQARQNRIAHLQAFRAMQADILAIVTSDPKTYLPCYGALTPEEQTATQQALFCAFRSRYWLAGMEVGEWDDHLLRNEFAPEIYGNDVSREWWGVASSYYRRQTASPTEKGLARVLDEEVARYLATTNNRAPVEPIADRVSAGVTGPIHGAEPRVEAAALGEVADRRPVQRVRLPNSGPTSRPPTMP